MKVASSPIVSMVASLRLWVSRRVGPFRVGATFNPRQRNAYRQSYAPVGQDAVDFVYVIQGREAVKIGVTRNLDDRLAALQTGSPHPLTLAYHKLIDGDAYAVEAEAHAMLDRHRLSGEWFSVPADVAVAAVNGAAYRLAPDTVTQAGTPSAPWLLRIGLIALAFAPAWACAAFQSPLPFLACLVAGMLAMVVGLLRIARGERASFLGFMRWLGAIVLGLSASVMFGMVGFLVLKHFMA